MREGIIACDIASILNLLHMVSIPFLLNSFVKTFLMCRDALLGTTEKPNDTS